MKTHHCGSTPIRIITLSAALLLASGCGQATSSNAPPNAPTGASVDDSVPLRFNGSGAAPSAQVEETGRPDFAGEQGPPDFAGEHGPPPHSHKGGNGDNEPPVYPPPSTTGEWYTAVNNTMTAPGSQLTFNSYNQPSVNDSGLVVFRARTRGGMGGGGEATRARGVYTRDMSGCGTDGADCPTSPIQVVADARTQVPLAPPLPGFDSYQLTDLGVTFTEFPSIPRIDANTDLVATRGQHEPVLEYTIDEESSRLGTTGIYANSGENGALETGASLLGAIPPYAYFSVPEPYLEYDPMTDPLVKFDVFPGAPSPTVTSDGQVVTFKGNYTVGDVGKTGVFYRYLDDYEPVHLIANSYTQMPNMPADTTFGSTASPSAHGDQLVFVGYYIEEQPYLGGGIYMAPISPTPELTTLVSIGDQVPGEPEGTGFTQFGEAVSFDGRYVAFWAGWGDETRTLFLPCPTEGNTDRAAYCNHEAPYDQGNGDANTTLFCPDSDAACVYGTTTTVPVNQGIFVYDTETGQTTMVAHTGENAPATGNQSMNITDFLYWNYSGAPPGVGDSTGSEEGGADADDREPPRFRSSAFVAVSGGVGDTALVAFKARDASFPDVTYTVDAPNDANPAGTSGSTYGDIVDSLYLAKTTQADTKLERLLSTGMDATILDASAVAQDGTPMQITELGLERDSLRAPWLTINASMATEATTEEEAEGMAGVYVRRVSTTPSVPVTP